MAGANKRGRADRGGVRERGLLAGGAVGVHEGEPRGLARSSARSQSGKVGKEDTFTGFPVVTVLTGPPIPKVRLVPKS